MAEILASAVAEETVSGVFSYVSTNREEKASERHNVERLEVAYTELGLAVERSAKMPITDVSLLHRRKMIKRKYEECRDVLQKCKLRVVEDEDQETKQVVTSSSSSFPKRIIHAVKSSVSSLLGLDKDDQLSCSGVVRRFEWFADKAGKFVRDVETGCTLAHFRFLSSVIRPLLQGKTILYGKEQGSQTLCFVIFPIFSEERGVEATLTIGCQDSETPTKSFGLTLMLRLAESTDIFGIALQGLEILQPGRFRSSALSAVIGELAHLPEQDVLIATPSPLDTAARKLCGLLNRDFHPDPLCCSAGSSGPCANYLPISLLPEQVNVMYLRCCAREADRNIERDCSFLIMMAYSAPHRSLISKLLPSRFETVERNDLQVINSAYEKFESNVVEPVISQPELRSYTELLHTAWLCFVYCPQVQHWNGMYSQNQGHALPSPRGLHGEEIRRENRKIGRSRDRAYAHA